MQDAVAGAVVAAVVVEGEMQVAEYLVAAASAVHLQHQQQACSSRAGLREPGMGFESGIATGTAAVTVTEYAYASDWGWSDRHLPYSDAAVVAV
jgi:hypothetical protein